MKNEDTRSQRLFDEVDAKYTIFSKYGIVKLVITYVVVTIFKVCFYFFCSILLYVTLFIDS
jgi:hypothetical protein